MENGLSEAFQRSLAVRNLSLSSLSRAQLPNTVGKSIDLDSLLLLEKPGKAVRALSPQQLYCALKEKGPENCLAILPHLSPEQFVRLIDYDAWQQGDLSAKKVFSWLELYQEIDPKMMLGRFASLDEEYQIAILNRYIRFYDAEDYEGLDEAKQDRLQQFPNQAFYFEISTDDPELHKSIQSLLEVAMHENMRYAIALVGYSSLSIPEESEHLLKQFRNSRLEEDGFVPYEQSFEIFAPLDLRHLGKPETAKLLSTEVAKKEDNFLDLVLAYGQRNASQEELAHIEISFLSLANHLCSALNLETHDRKGLEYLLKQGKSLVAIGLEYLAGKDPEACFLLLKSQYPKNLFRFGLFLIHELRVFCLSELKHIDLAKAEAISRYFARGKAETVCDLIDSEFLEILGLEDCQRLGALFQLLPLKLTKIGEAYILTVIHDLADLSKLNAELSELFARHRKN